MSFKILVANNIANKSNKYFIYLISFFAMQSKLSAGKMILYPGLTIILLIVGELPLYTNLLFVM